MKYNVYALVEQRGLPSGKRTFDRYKVCPTQQDAMDVYREKVGEPRTVREEIREDGIIWWLDEDSTGAAYIVRYVLDGPLEESR